MANIYGGGNQGQQKAERAQQAGVPVAERQVFDVVCGKGVRPEEAIASREYGGETLYFCCVGCAEAFDANPEAYLRQAPIRAYAMEERYKTGAEAAAVKEAEAAVNRYPAEISAAEERARAARANVARLEGELEAARARLAKSQAELESLSARQRQAPAVAVGPDVAALEQRISQERSQLAAALLIGSSASPETAMRR